MYNDDDDDPTGSMKAVCFMLASFLIGTLVAMRQICYQTGLSLF